MLCIFGGSDFKDGIVYCFILSGNAIQDAMRTATLMLCKMSQASYIRIAKTNIGRKAKPES